MNLRKIRLTPDYLRDHMGEVLEAVRQEDIPRVLCEGPGQSELAALVNAKSLDRLVEAAEQMAEMSREPLRKAYEDHMIQWKEERRVLLEDRAELVDRVALDVCAKCRRKIRERYGDGEKESLGAVWRRLAGGLGAEVVVSGTVTDEAGGEGAPGV